jgi:hypothetical protein
VNPVSSCGLGLKYEKVEPAPYMFTDRGTGCGKTARPGVCGCRVIGIHIAEKEKFDMTMIISEASERFGCVVVGDSAVTIGTRVVHGAEKIHYSYDANIGFAIWGNACLNGQRLVPCII